MFIVEPTPSPAQPTPEPASPKGGTLFDVHATELIPAIATALAALITAHNPKDETAIPPELRPFAGSIRFDGSDTERQIHALLDKLVHCGVAPPALIVAYCLTSRLAKRVRGDAAEPVAVIPPTTAKALILTTAILASKFNFDVGARMKEVKADDALLAELGDGLVLKFGMLEEHLLTTFDWQLRVSTDEFVAAYASVQALAAPGMLQLPADPIVRRIRSMPTAGDPGGASPTQAEAEADAGAAIGRSPSVPTFRAGAEDSNVQSPSPTSPGVGTPQWQIDGCHATTLQRPA